MPPYYWHKVGEESTLDPHQSGLVEEIPHKQLATTSTQTHQQQDFSTLDSRRSELVEERVEQTPTTSRQAMIQDQRTNNSKHGKPTVNKSHADVNALMLINQDRRSVLISDEETNQRIDPIDDNFEKTKSVFERLGVAPTSLLNTNKDALKDNCQYHTRDTQSDIKQPKVDSNITQKESFGGSDSCNRQSQTQHKSSLQDKYQQGLHNQNKLNNKPREHESYGRDGKGENAHNRGTSRESHQNRQHYQEKQGSSSQFYNKWSHQQQQVPNKHGFNNKSNEQSYNQRYYESKGRQQETYESSKQPENRSSIKITNINNQDKQNKSTLNLVIERRPLSPLNKIKPKDNVKNASKVSSTKPYVPCIPSKTPTIVKPAVVTVLNNKIIKPQMLKVPEKELPITPKVPNTETPKIASPRIENETFEDIAESGLPRIKDTPSSNTPQSNTMSQNLTSDQEDSTLDPRQSGLVEETTQTNTNTLVSETQATSIAESTRDESKAHCLGNARHQQANQL